VIKGTPSLSITGEVSFSQETAMHRINSESVKNPFFIFGCGILFRCKFTEKVAFQD
jgi:hypothetical protein